MVGTRSMRHDEADRAPGRAQHGAGTGLPDMLRGRILGSPQTHAWMKSIDSTPAEAHPYSVRGAHRFSSPRLFQRHP